MWRDHPESASAAGDFRSRRRRRHFRIAALAAIALFAMSFGCSVQGDECDRDADCRPGEYCQSAGGVFVRGSICVPNSSTDAPVVDATSDGADRPDGNLEDGADGTGVPFFDADPTQWPRCADPDCECQRGRCRRRCETDEDCSLACGLGASCKLSCPSGSDCELSSCAQLDCALGCREGSDCRIEDCSQSECRIRCHGPDCGIENCVQSECVVICLGGTCTIETCAGDSTCELRCEDESGNCDLRCSGSGCQCEGSGGCREP